jgi:FkbM family methyltransferase
VDYRIKKHPEKYLLDFGTHFGEGLDRILRLEKCQHDMEVHSFEANPYTFKKNTFKPDVNYYNLGISDKTGFYYFNCAKENEGEPTGGGSTLMDLSVWDDKDIYKKGVTHTYKEVQVFCLSAVDLLDRLLPNKTEKSIVAKFDIEGAEYPIFNLLLETDNLKWFSKIYVEFHEYCFKEGVPFQGESGFWMDIFKSNGIEGVVWR